MHIFHSSFIAEISISAQTVIALQIYTLTNYTFLNSILNSIYGACNYRSALTLEWPDKPKFNIPVHT